MNVSSQAFLQQIASYILDHFSGETGDCCVVLPNRRAGLFLKKYLSELSDKPLWSPQIFSIEDFIFKLSGLQEADSFNVLFEFYKIYLEQEKDQAAPFDSFVGWASVVLQDFNDVDLYLADPEKVFAHISEARALDIWNPGGQALTTFEKNYIRFYQSLHLYYKKLTGKLLSRMQAYQGLAYRNVAENLKKSKDHIPYKKLLFVGFNAM